MEKRTELTVREVAEQLGAAIPTVTLWCRSGRLPNARQVETPRGPVWYIPESDIESIEVRGRGRPPKPEADSRSTPKASNRKAVKNGRR
jgi:hypothetical protein